ncbi:glycosyltransferase [Anoxybacillus rupiensis]|uniref:Glycosyltransferase n=1 Tax=Anoxybacteroides rupiense TaxID=311460 RepID=A0ABT5W576_9BACL|nr:MULTISPECIES: glycosyltransferase [Anoxybacillus]MDE8564468.1 glycosyltransferase [Anoxybacillus rupiensis]
MTTLALVMIVKNEERHLGRCLQSVKDIVDEIIIVDTGSTDRTKDIASSFGAKIFDFKWIDDFSAARNYALEQSTSDWNLVLDADEYVINQCESTIRRFLEKDEKKIGRIRRIDEFIQNGEKRYAQSYLSRLLPKGVKYVGRVHEQIETDLPREDLDIEVYHDGYIATDKTDRNLNLLLLELEKDPFNDYVLYQIGKQYKLKQQLRQAERYFEKSYQLVPLYSWYRHNLVVDYLYTVRGNQSFEKGIKLIETEQNSLADSPDFHFACGLFYMDLIFSDVNQYIHLFPLIEQSFLRCLAIGDTAKYDSVKGTGSFLALYNLGVFHEALGNVNKAISFYQKAADLQYGQAIKRLEMLNRQ